VSEDSEPSLPFPLHPHPEHTELINNPELPPNTDHPNHPNHRRPLLTAAAVTLSLLGLPETAAGPGEVIASITLRGPLARRHPLWAGLSMAGDVASDALGRVACPPGGGGGVGWADCGTAHAAALAIHLVVDVLNLSPY